MHRFQVLSKSLADTNKIAAQITPFLKLNDLVILEGNLGGGKTYFVKAFGKSLNTEELVTSPTYAIANFYPIPTGNIIHIDAYRLSDINEYRDLGLDEYFDEAIVFMEWGKKFANEFPEFLLMQIYLVEADENYRLVEFSYQGTDWEKRFSSIYEQLAAFRN